MNKPDNKNIKEEKDKALIIGSGIAIPLTLFNKVKLQSEIAASTLETFDETENA